MSHGASAPQQRPPASTTPRAQPSGAPSAAARVVSAARTQPLPPEPARPLKGRVVDGASDTLLNTAAAARELLADFRGRDRFFKYKAGILAGWLLLSVASIGVACPSGALRRSAQLGARLVLAGDAQHPVYTLFNDSAGAWTDVTVIVNGHYRAASARVSPGGNLTLTPSQLIGADGMPAAPNLRLRELVVRTTEGDEVLMRNGRLLE